MSAFEKTKQKVNCRGWQTTCKCDGNCLKKVCDHFSTDFEDFKDTANRRRIENGTPGVWYGAFNARTQVQPGRDWAMAMLRNAFKRLNGPLKRQGKMMTRGVMHWLCAVLFWLMELEGCFSQATGLTTDDFAADADLVSRMVVGAMDKNRPSAFLA